MKINYIIENSMGYREHSLVKEQTSYGDLLDALRLALKGYNIE